MFLETERLLLFPLTGNQLQLLLTDLPEFEKQTACHYEGESLTGELYDIFLGQIIPMKDAGKEYVWHTFWMIVLKKEDTIVGSICFKDKPAEDGSIEIGYGLNLHYESCGYMTEAVGAMMNWAFGQPGVKSITAEVNKDNIPSQRVVLKNGFKIYKKIGNFNWYHITK